MIDAQRLHLIRQERRAHSEYASLARCQADIRRAHAMFQRLGIRVLDTTTQSLEEIASHILNAGKNKHHHAEGNKPLPGRRSAPGDRVTHAGCRPATTTRTPA